MTARADIGIKGDDRRRGNSCRFGVFPHRAKISIEPEQQLINFAFLSLDIIVLVNINKEKQADHVLMFQSI